MTRIDPCPACGGEGRDIRCGIVYEAGCGHGHRGDVDYGECQVCHGTGDLEVEDFDLDIYDLEERAPVLGAEPREETHTRISMLAGVDAEGGILPPSTEGGIDRSPKEWWKSR